MTLFSLLRRFTPTYMGNTPTKSQDIIFYSVHPHIHGEYDIWSLGRFSLRGSPPHTWGIQLSATRICLTFRFTPTYMGNTPTKSQDIIFYSVHPHIHGEYDIWSLGGSHCAVHPHIHGEYVKEAAITWQTPGSPPHTWGILSVSVSPRSGVRFTPTYMGNTLLSKTCYSIRRFTPTYMGNTSH